MRPLAGVLCAGEGTFVLDGTPRMRERPIDDLVDGLLQVSLDFLEHFYSSEENHYQMRKTLKIILCLSCEITMSTISIVS